MEVDPSEDVLQLEQKEVCLPYRPTPHQQISWPSDPPPPRLALNGCLEPPPPPHSLENPGSEPLLAWCATCRSWNTRTHDECV